MTSTHKKTRKRTPPLTAKEKHFARLLAEGVTSPEAGRRVFGWKCEMYTPEYNKVRDLARAARIKEFVKNYREKKEAQARLDTMVQKENPEWDNLTTLAYNRLKEVRDNINVPAKQRLRALEALEAIRDPSQDINLIWQYVSLVWNGLDAHCPRCHSDFPLWKVKNKALDEWREASDKKDIPQLDDIIERRLYLLTLAEKRRRPSSDQLKALSSTSRHLLGRGAARAGKSVCLAMFGFLFILIPGAESWFLARIYEDASKEIEFLKDFLKTAFYPLEKYMYNVIEDKKTGDLHITTKWGAVIRVKSAKSKGSITAKELEACLVAEPGWVDGDIFEEVRARMSSRLGRIIALGTPKSFKGFLGRLMRMATRDMRTGKRLEPGSRMAENGCPWGQSIFDFWLRPETNPEYVTSELEAAKSELTEEEYASEFEGRLVGEGHLKFPNIKDEHLIDLSNFDYTNSVFVLGVDQGQKNFASCLLGWDGHKIRVAWEYFDREDENTIRTNLITVNKRMPHILTSLGHKKDSWKMTIFDADPKVDGTLIEMEKEHQPWVSDITFRPKNQKDLLNWRQETYVFINEMSKAGNIIFDNRNCDQLHEQLMEVLNKPESNDRDGGLGSSKGWIVNDIHRGDHVCFHPETEFLTVSGWKKISDAVEGELAMTRSPEGVINYMPVLKTYEIDYDGDMIECNAINALSSFSVTPNHNLYVRKVSEQQKKNKNAELFFIKAGDFYDGKLNKRYAVPAASRPTVLGKGLTLSKFDPKGFSYALGFYLSDGCRSISGGSKTKYVHFDKGDKKLLQGIAKKLGLDNNPYKTATCWRLSIADPYLYDLLGDKKVASNKRIPRWFFDEANLDEHKAIFEGLMDGDGTWTQRKYDSISRGLIDDFQELVSRLGVVSSQANYKYSNYYDINGRSRVSNNKNPVIFRVRYRRLDKLNKHSFIERSYLEKVPYKGKVYCVFVPPFNNIFTRRRGKTMWIGQCDAFVLACWVIYTGELYLEAESKTIHDPFEEAKRALEYRLKVDEKRELGLEFNNEDVFMETFGRDQFDGNFFDVKSWGHYSDES